MSFARIFNLFILALFPGIVFAQEGAPFAAVDPEGNTMQARSFNLSTFHPYTYSGHLSDELKKLVHPSFQTHPEFGSLPYNAGIDEGEEIIDERTEFSRTFVQRGKGFIKRFAQQGYYPLHYKDNQGRWLTLDERLHPSVDNPGQFDAIHQPYPTSINVIEGFTKLVHDQHTLKFNSGLLLYYEDANNNRVLIGSADWTQYTAGNDGVYVTNAWPGIDIQLLASGGKIKTNYIITSPVSYSSGHLVFVDQLSLNNGGTYSYESEQTNTYGHHLSGIKAFTTEGVEVFRISEAYGFDQSHDMSSNQTFGYELKPGNIWELFVPVSWAGNAAFSFPLVVDPLVTSSNTLPQASITGSFNQSTGLFTSSCDYNMSVPTPANCTITNVRWSFTYIAQNGAVLCYGANRFTVNGCLSPSAPGFYWFCNNCVFAGTCTGTNVSIWTDVSSCIPAPQCLSYNLPTTLHFFARAVPNIGCSNFYIGANSNWIVTIEGNTITQATPPSSSNGTTICLGNSTTLTATATFGVPPYTYLWNPGGATTNPVTVAPVVTTTYTCIITDACGITASNQVTITVNTTNTLTTPSIYSFMNPASGNPCPVTVTFCSNEATGNNYGGGAETWQWSFAGGTQLSGGALNGSSNGPQYGGAGADATCSSNTPGGAAYTVQYSTPGNYIASFTIYKSGACGTVDIPLAICLSTAPIELLDFIASYTGKVVELNWRTASETNNDYFTVERSVDGINFVLVAVVDGAGTSSVLHSYSTIDDSPPLGVVYYRLKQTDHDLQVSYSDLKSVFVVRNSISDLILLPNPAGDEAYAIFSADNFSGAKVTISIIDVSSRVLWIRENEFSTGENSLRIDLSGLLPGQYLIELRSGDQLRRKVLIKQ